MYNDEIAYESTLAEALNSLFGEGSAHESKTGKEAKQDQDEGEGGDKTLSKTEIIQKCQEAYDNAQDALKDGDWEKYGKYMGELEKYLNELN